MSHQRTCIIRRAVTRFYDAGEFLVLSASVTADPAANIRIPALEIVARSATTAPCRCVRSILDLGHRALLDFGVASCPLLSLRSHD